MFCRQRLRRRKLLSQTFFKLSQIQSIFCALLFSKLSLSNKWGHKIFNYLNNKNNSRIKYLGINHLCWSLTDPLALEVWWYPLTTPIVCDSRKSEVNYLSTLAMTNFWHRHRDDKIDIYGQIRHTDEPQLSERLLFDNSNIIRYEK